MMARATLPYVIYSMLFLDGLLEEAAEKAMGYTN